MTYSEMFKQEEQDRMVRLEKWGKENGQSPDDLAKFLVISTAINLVSLFGFDNDADPEEFCDSLEHNFQTAIRIYLAKAIIIRGNLP